MKESVLDKLSIDNVINFIKKEKLSCKNQRIMSQVARDRWEHFIRLLEYFRCENSRIERTAIIHICKAFSSTYGSSFFSLEMIGG